MKFKTTKKKIKQNFDKIIKLSHDYYYLLKYENPTAYAVRGEGWACDFYIIDGVCLSVGYDPIGTIKNYDLQKKYNDKAKKIYNDLKDQYFNNNKIYNYLNDQYFNNKINFTKYNEELKRQLKENLNNFIMEVLK